MYDLAFLIPTTAREEGKRIFPKSFRFNDTLSRMVYDLSADTPYRAEDQTPSMEMKGTKNGERAANVCSVFLMAIRAVQQVPIGRTTSRTFSLYPLMVPTTTNATKW